MRIRHFALEAEWIEASLKEFADALRIARSEDRRLDVVLAGGSTPGPMYRVLALREFSGPPPRLWPGDERRLPLGHPERNDHLIADIFAAAVWKPTPELRAWPDASDVDPAATYAKGLAETLSPRPSFDFAFLGVGNDGHTAGLFPGDPSSMAALEPAYAGLAVHTIAPARPWLRMSLAGPVLASARKIVFLTKGREKLAMLEKTMGEEGRNLPWRRVASLAQERGAEVLIYHLDAG
ncbi:MAG TPA: 6-phosphogluconolactonase [Rectinemataceae bacterium]|nr:6-phosphogluconolactonase [Rectinemataceae bacterium]